MRQYQPQGSLENPASENPANNRSRKNAEQRIRVFAVIHLQGRIRKPPAAQYFPDSLLTAAAPTPTAHAPARRWIRCARPAVRGGQALSHTGQRGRDRRIFRVSEPHRLSGSSSSFAGTG